MAKILRKNSKVFGDTVATADVGVFASFVSTAGSPVTSKDPDLIQSTEYVSGAWKAATVAQENPFLEERNGLDFLFSRQISYNMQAGIPEWDTATSYYIGDYAREVGGSTLYTSVTDDNLGNALTDLANWTPVIGGAVGTALPRGYIDGAIMSNATDTDHDILIGVTTCRDSTDSRNMFLSSSITKQIDATFAEGDNVGGFPDTLTLAIDTWYHIIEMIKADGTVDVGFDTAINGSNLLADTVVAAAGYTEVRRVGSVLTDGSLNIIQFFQDGDVFLWKDGTILDITTTATTTATDFPVSSPLGVKTEPFGTFNTANGIVNIVSPDITNSLPSTASGVGVGDGSNSQNHNWKASTDTSSQISIRADANTAIDVNTQGYTDKRGKQ